MCRRKLFPDTIINQEKRTVPDRKPSEVTDPVNHVMGRRAVTQPTRLMAHDAEEDPNCDEEGSCEEDSDLAAAHERGMDELASVVEELEVTLDGQDVEELRGCQSPCMKDSPPSERRMPS